jgi:threonine dehydrogenase-like Zn-dependent dehydrogenase
MWAHMLTGPGRLESRDVPDLDPAALEDNQVLVRFEAGSICGSDLPSFLGRRNPVVHAHGDPGYPLHEVVGKVAATRSDIDVGARVVGWSHEMRGLAEYFIAPAHSLLVLEDTLTSIHATAIQPLCTVLHALDRIPDIAGRRAAVIGQGTLGILFSHALKSLGASVVTGVDRVDRSDVATAFGVDEARWSHSTNWANDLLDTERPDIVIEAVGHQAGTLNDAVNALAPEGTIFAFGVPDDAYYAFPFERFFRKNAKILGGVATHRRAALMRARDYLERYPTLPDQYVTDVLPVDQAQLAYETAARPAAGRLKVALAD